MAEPQDVKAEEAVIGSCFLSGDALISSMEILSPDDFTRPLNRLIYQTMIKLNDQGQPIDVVSITSKLGNSGLFKSSGGAAYIAKVSTSVPSAGSVNYYAKLVHNAAIRRKLIDVSTKIINHSNDDNEDVTDLLDQAEQSILSISANNTQKGMTSVSTILHDTFNEVVQLSEGKIRSGISTGYQDLDNILDGLHEDELIILAARPAVGKTAFALNLAENVAIKDHKPVAIFSLEMGAKSLVNRMICAEGMINANRLRTGQLHKDEWDALSTVIGELAETDIFIDDTPGIKVSQIRAKCRRLQKSQGSLGLVVIDYLQLIEGGNAESRVQEVSKISRQLKKLAKELHTPVLALSQLSRGVEQRQDKRPVLSDIRDSGSIEQDADTILFIYREDYYKYQDKQEDANNLSPSETEISISKNRSGPRGTIKLLFLKTYNKFVPRY